MRGPKGLIEEHSFVWGTGLDFPTLRKYREFGFIKPIIEDRGVTFYSEDSLRLVRVMWKYIDGKHNLRQAYQNALKDLEVKVLKAA
jgi:hypothetical protein